MANHAPVALADLLRTRTALTAPDAVALVVQLARSPQMGRPTGIRLDASHVWLHPDGAVTLSPGLLPPLSDVAGLLESMLNRVEASAPVPQALRSVVDRASGKAGLPIPTLTAFAKALAPFEPPDAATAVSTLVARLDEPPVPAPVVRAPVEAEAITAILPAPPPIPVAVPMPVAAPAPLAAPARATAPTPVAAPARVAAPTPVAAPVRVAAPTPVVTPALVQATRPLEPVGPAVPAPAAWRPARWQVAGAAAATVLAAVLGAAIGRWDHAESIRRQPPPSTRTASAREATYHPAPTPAPAPIPEPEMVTPPANEPPFASLPAPSAPAAPVASRTESVAASSTSAPTRAFDDSPSATATPQPARLVDHRTVQADAVFSPSFAANGSAVFFHAESGSGSALKRAEPGDRGELRVATIVDDGARNYHVQLSPDGKQVAFDSDRDGERGVYVADANGRGVHRISGPGYAAVPTWAPDGQRLAFLRAEADRPGVWNLWMLDRRSGEQTRLTRFRQGQVWGGAWFGDGRRIAYSHEDRLTIRDLASGQSREFASPLPRRLVRTPAVSPDGRWIMFQVYRDGAWLLDVERGVMQRVLQDPSAEEFAWSPDGRRVAYHSQRSGGWNLWTMAAP